MYSVPEFYNIIVSEEGIHSMVELMVGMWMELPRPCQKKNALMDKNTES